MTSKPNPTQQPGMISLFPWPGGALPRSYFAVLWFRETVSVGEGRGYRLPPTSELRELPMRRMIWAENDDFTGWCCSHCLWGLIAPRLETTVAALAFNRVAQESFEKHACAGSIPANRGSRYPASAEKPAMHRPGLGA